MQEVFKIGDRAVGLGQPAFITAEIGLNHNGDPEMAKRMIKAAAEAGVDAVKFQVFRAESFISGDIAKSKYQKARTDSDETLFEMWHRLELSTETLHELSDYARSQGVPFYASAFDSQSADVLAELGVPAFKVASGEVTNLPLLREVAKKQLPMLMSVAMASVDEIKTALDTISHTGNKRVAILHCVANYPARLEDANLKRIEKLRQTFALPVGYSDHTTSVWAPAAAVALGAVFLEKHFTLDKNLPGTDHMLSADPLEMKTIVDGVRAVEAALGSDKLELLETEREVRVLARRGLVATRAISAGAVITNDMVAAKRPATGIEPAQLENVIGRTARRDIAGGAPITWDDIAPSAEA